MGILSKRDQWVIAAILGLLLLATRNNHFASLHALPGASWAVFFIAGFYIQTRWALAAFMAMAGLIDLNVYWQGGGEGFCFTKSYAFLIPAYTAMWLGGRWYRNRHQTTVASLPVLTAAVLFSTFVCELLSSGSFYFLSERIENPSISGYFTDNFMVYYLGYLGSAAFYVAITACIHVCFAQLRKHQNKFGRDMSLN